MTKVKAILSTKANNTIDILRLWASVLTSPSIVRSSNYWLTGEWRLQARRLLSPHLLRFFERLHHLSPNCSPQHHHDTTICSPDSLNATALPSTPLPHSPITSLSRRPTVPHRYPSTPPPLSSTPLPLAQTAVAGQPLGNGEEVASYHRISFDDDADVENDDDPVA
ncbi:hypothetical protein Cgig2_023547 [Carnegiea gigantea]|uniref:Uncharacterized protein n=1 Tax=Carnegiea gigantea TaxID=171969 RepID=A0A9Q1JTT4_9CARY|nr:hypothetical protein Cgig2_023547 [Carnegiea gigantea]